MRGVFCCPSCGQPNGGGRVCGRRRCSTQPTVDSVVAAGPYADARLRALLREYKYNGVQEARDAVLGLFGGFLAGHLPLFESLDAEAIIPVPMHPWRLAARGFNQAEELAVVAGELLGVPVETAALRRRWRFRRQAELEGRVESRVRNAAGSVCSVGDLSGIGSVMLVDDVVTTGATVREAAAALRGLGVSRVHVLSFLRS